MIVDNVSMPAKKTQHLNEDVFINKLKQVLEGSGWEIVHSCSSSQQKMVCLLRIYTTGNSLF